MAREFLERQEVAFDIRPATSVDEAGDYLSEHEVDCIISDYDLPERNGLEFLEAVRETDPELPFILFTGHGSETIASRAISAGVTDYVQKQPQRHHYAVLANRIEMAVDRYRARQAVRTTKQRLEELAEHSNDILYLFTRDWDELLFINSAYEDIWGRSVDALREDPSDFIDGVHPDDRDTLKRSMAALSNGEPVEQEYRVNAEEGYGRWVWTEGEPIFDDSGAVVRIAGFARDITHLRRREQALQKRGVDEPLSPGTGGVLASDD
ncbi:MAG: response regulator [Halobacteriales archaeon]